MSTVNRFEEKRLKDAAAKEHLDHIEEFKKAIALWPDMPIWPLAISLQEEFVKPDYREQHLDYVVMCSRDEDSMCVKWMSKVRGEPEMFLSIQATNRPVPQLHEVAPSEILDEFLFMIEDINQNDKGAAAMLARAAINAFKEHLVTSLDGDPAANLYLIQAYTKDRKYLLDIQLDYAVIQDDIEHQGKLNGQV